MGTRERRDRSNKIDHELRVSFLESAKKYLAKPEQVSLTAVGGYGRGELSPGSDLDLLILHDASEKPTVISEFVNAFLYPLWDKGRAVDHSVRTRSETREIAQSDIRVALGLLDLRHIAGNSEISSAVSSDAIEDWRKNQNKFLPKLKASILEREKRSGELAFLLEPDLKEARGGLRDINALRAIEMSGVVSVSLARVAESEALLANVRDVLHGENTKAKDQLQLTEQDRVAAAMGFKDADVLMLEVAKAARAVDYLMDLTWHRIDSLEARGWFRKGGKSKAQNIDRGLVILNSEVTIEENYDVIGDPGIGLRAAATAAQRGLPLSVDACLLLAEKFSPIPTPWPKAVADDLVSLIGGGAAMIRVFEALDQEGLIEKWIPEWSHVRFLPQRNVLHRHTVDRHMLETAVHAAALTRTVKRPDILLVAALFHDIGKGFANKDHSEYGEELIRPLAKRLGFDQSDCEQIALLIREHLLLSAVATRRDLEDPATLQYVVEKVGDPESLQLLHALSISDGEATGKSGWSDWKAGLVVNLVNKCLAVMAGVKPVSQPDLLPTAPVTEDLLIRILSEPNNHEQIEIEIVAKDQTGLLSAVAGLMTISRFNVRSAKTRTTDGIAVMRWIVELDANAQMSSAEKLTDQLNKALSGELDLGRKIDERIDNYRKYPGIPTPPPVVYAANDLATNATIIEVRMHDRPGILFTVARAISRFGVDIKSAIVSTLGAEAFDTLYVTDLAGQPLTGERAQLLATKVENILITHL